MITMRPVPDFTDVQLRRLAITYVAASLRSGTRLSIPASETVTTTLRTSISRLGPVTSGMLYAVPEENATKPAANVDERAERSHTTALQADPNDPRCSNLAGPAPGLSVRPYRSTVPRLESSILPMRRAAPLVRPEEATRSALQSLKMLDILAAPQPNLFDARYLPMETARTPLPLIGFGTGGLTGTRCIEATGFALACGYRLLDTAARYANESEVGVALRESRIARQDVQVITKIWVDRIDQREIVLAAEESNRRLGVDYIDYLLLHTPSSTMNPVGQSLSELELCRQMGIARFIGLSNFPARLLREASDHAMQSGFSIDMVQLEHHPYLQQQALIDFAQQVGCRVTAYSPLCQGAVLYDSVLKRIARANGTTVSQAVLGWMAAKKCAVPLPNSSQPSHILENLDLGVKLSNAEIAEIDALERAGRTISFPWVNWD